MKTLAIVNPSSGGGRCGRHLGRIEGMLRSALDGSGRTVVTRGPGDATAAARAAALDGCEVVVGVGGDGTMNEIVNGLFAGGRAVSPSCRLGLLSMGTGRGFAESLGLPVTLEAQCDVIRRGGSRLVDAALVRFRGPDGEEIERVLVNECQVGIGESVVGAATNGRKRAFGRLTYGLATLLRIFVEREVEGSVTVDGRTVFEGSLLGVVVSNGSRTGGGMRLAPEARVDDGLLDVVVMHGLSVRRRLRAIPRIYAGTHVRAAGFTCVRGRSIDIVGSTPLAADGETLGSIPCLVSVLPAALRVCAAKEGS